MKDYKLISKIALWCLLALGIIVAVMFFVGGTQGSREVAGDILDIPRFSDLFLVWNYILLALVILVTFGFVIWGLVDMFKTDSKRAVKVLCVVCGFALYLVLCWVLGSGAEMKIIGYEGTDNVGAMAKLSDACLYAVYGLVCATICTLIGGVIYTKRLK